VRFGQTRVLAAVAFAILTAGVVPAGLVGGLLSPPLVRAQNIGQRAVFGIVVDANSNVVSGATVFLKDPKTKTIRSFTSDSAGNSASLKWIWQRTTSFGLKKMAQERGQDSERVGCAQGV